MNWTYLLLGQKGRINRRHFLLGLLPITLLLALVWLFLTRLTGLLPRWATIALPAIITLEALYFLACLSIKRLHDYGRPAHYLWLLFSPMIFVALFSVQQKFIPLQAYGLLLTKMVINLYIVLTLLVLLAFLWIFGEMLLRRGDPQKNRFGAPENG